ncbi:MAG: hypothetical protein WC061_06340 [Melioribacteraceae bacterium]
MLEKIVNISAGSDYKQSSKPGRYSKVSRYISEYHPAGNDSISLSPATGFLSILGWKLKKIRSDKELIQVEFTFDDLDFSTTLNPNEFYQLHRFEYIIKYLLGNYLGSSELTVRIASFLDADISENNRVKVNLPEIKNFLELIYSSLGHKSNLSSDLFEVQKTFSESESRLISEFNYINKNLIGFLEKYLSTKMNFKMEQNENHGRLELNSLHIRKF